MTFSHSVCISMHNACLLLKVNTCPRKPIWKVQWVAAKQITRLVSRCIWKNREQTHPCHVSSHRHFLEKAWSTAVILRKTNSIHLLLRNLAFFTWKDRILGETYAYHELESFQSFSDWSNREIHLCDLGCCDKACQCLEDWWNVLQQYFLSGHCMMLWRQSWV